MLVSNGKYSYWRGSVKGKLSRNGSFIDVFFERDGVTEWIGIPEDDLRRLLEISGHGAKIEAYINHDVPANGETALALFLRQRSVKDFGDVHGD